MRRYTEEEKAEILKEVESLGNVSLVSKKRGISHTTIHTWVPPDPLYSVDKDDEFIWMR